MENNDAMLDRDAQNKNVTMLVTTRDTDPGRCTIPPFILYFHAVSSTVSVTVHILKLGNLTTSIHTALMLSGYVLPYLIT